MPGAASTPPARSASAAPDRRERILEAATVLFGRAGVFGTTADEIAAAAGITKRTLYRHMGSKNQILLEVLESSLVTAMEELQQIQASLATPLEQLRELIICRIVRLLEHPNASKVTQEAKHLDEPGRSLLQKRQMSYEDSVEDVVRDGMTRGELRVADPQTTTRMLLATLSEDYVWYSPQSDHSPAELGVLVADQIFLGISTEGEMLRPLRRLHP